MPRMPAKRKSIADDTAILPYLVAEGVVGRLQGWLRENAETLSERVVGRDDPVAHVTALADLLAENDRALGDALAKRADAAYLANDGFARKVHGSGNAGRDYLIGFVQHWLCADILAREGGKYADVARALPTGYAVGEELPEAAPAPGR